MNEQAVKITPELIVEVIQRRRWVILLPICLTVIVGIYFAIVLPRLFEARTLILIEPQRVPQNYVQSIVTEAPGERINTISQQILSRTNLDRIIKEFSLFSGPEHARMLHEDKIGSLRRRITVDLSLDRRRETDAFTIAFKDPDPALATRITNTLATFFIDENIRTREIQASGTSQFLDAELTTMRDRLEQVEENMKEFRRIHMGELPEQLDSNLRILDNLQVNLTGRQESLRQARMRLAELNYQAANRPQPMVVFSGDQRSTTRSLPELRAELETLQSRYTEQHPDIIRTKKMIVEMEAAAQADTGAPPRIQELPIELRRPINDLQQEIQTIEQDISRVRAQIATYERRIEQTPKREQELLSLRRDYDRIRETYNSLLNRKLEADIAVNMERKQKGEQFRILDAAKLPERPIEPDMRKLFALILMAGFAVGGGLAFLLEYLNTSFRKADDIENALKIPVLASIPGLLSPKKLMFVRVSNGLSIACAVITVGLIGVLGYICTIGPEPVVSTFRNFMAG
jgi:polysaccharide chain length determinant protein (PEP-CTERM system associated)